MFLILLWFYTVMPQLFFDSINLIKSNIQAFSIALLNELRVPINSFSCLKRYQNSLEIGEYLAIKGFF